MTESNDRDRTDAASASTEAPDAVEASAADEEAADAEDAGDAEDAEDAADAADAEDAEDGAAEKTAEKSNDAGGDKGGGMMVGLLGFLLALGVGFFVGQFIQDKSADVEIETGDRFKVALRGDEPQIGPNDALVTIIEFADYQCPYCAKAHEPLQAVVDKFEGDVRLIYKHFPLPSHTRATPAAKAGWAAHQQGKFWEMHEVLFEKKASIDEAVAAASGLGLDVETFKAQLVSPEAGRAVDEDLKAGAMLGVRGTPAFFVNGHAYKGLKSAAQWTEIVEAELAEAKRLVDGGTPRAEVYGKLMADAKTEGHHPAGGLEAPAGGPDPSAVYKIPVQGRPSLGPDDALVTVVVFSDFQCPYCERLKPVVHELVERNPDVRVVFVNLPLPMHPRARDAALAALAAGRQGKFWPMHDKLFDERSGINGADFSAWAEELGLDVAKFEADLADPELAQQIATDEAIARRFKINSTPSAFVNGRLVRGAQGVEVYEELVAQERTKAQALIDAGTPASQVYDRLLADAKTEVTDG